MLTELGHCDRLKIHVNPSKIYVNPGIKVHSNDSFSEATAPLILKIYMQHDKAAGLQKNKFRLLGNQKWPLLLKIAKPLKSTFPPEPFDMFVKKLDRALVAP